MVASSFTADRTSSSRSRVVRTLRSSRITHQMSKSRQAADGQGSRASLDIMSSWLVMAFLQNKMTWVLALVLWTMPIATTAGGAADSQADVAAGEQIATVAR